MRELTKLLPKPSAEVKIRTGKCSACVIEIANGKARARRLRERSSNFATLADCLIKVGTFITKRAQLLLDLSSE